MLTIREVEPSDIATVRDVLVATWHATYDSILGAEKVTEITDVWHSVGSLSRQIDVAQTAFLLAEDDGRIIATSHAGLDEDGALVLGRLYVSPPEQGRGVGKALLDETIARFPHAALMKLEVERQNLSAIRFYKHNAFRQITAAGAASVAGPDTVAMDKMLAASPGTGV